ncbi:hypothetical protein FQN57_002936 [Myotisia sp. PD_48]|nr:hypothetical protein FQN57_002936 [Myotisia sp. PD_48]
MAEPVGQEERRLLLSIDDLNPGQSQLAECFQNRQARFQRVVSMRALNCHIDSSESMPSEHSSLYAALLGSFGSEDNELQESRAKYASANGLPDDLMEAPDGIRLTYLERGRRRSALAVPSLGTIMELFAHNVEPSYSRTCESIDALVNSKLSRSNFFSIASSLRREKYGSKIYAFDDLDIRPTVAFSSPSVKRRKSWDSFYSHRSLQYTASLGEIVSLVEPTQPNHPPPIRPHTPPGLPSFGSPDAIRYQQLAAYQRHSASGHDHPPELSRRLEKLPGNLTRKIRSYCGTFIRNLFEIAQLPPPCSLSQLPSGTIARAEDGTLISGRFGNRQSGHGVGAGPFSRGIESHPFHHNSLPAARSDENPSQNYHPLGNIRRRPREPVCSRIAEDTFWLPGARGAAAEAAIPIHSPVCPFRLQDSICDRHSSPPTTSQNTGRQILRVQQMDPSMASCIAISEGEPAVLSSSSETTQGENNVDNCSRRAVATFRRYWHLISSNSIFQCCGLQPTADESPCCQVAV